MKIQATEWHSPIPPRPAKFQRKQGKLKMRVIFAYAIRGVLTIHRVETGQTVNGIYYYKGYFQKRPRWRSWMRARLETRRSRVRPPPRSATFFRGD